MLSVVLLSVPFFNVMLNVFKLSVQLLIILSDFYCYDEFHFAEHCYAEFYVLSMFC
jgi:hypothetical protein